MRWARELLSDSLCHYVRMWTWNDQVIFKMSQESRLLCKISWALNLGTNQNIFKKLIVGQQNMPMNCVQPESHKAMTSGPW